MQKVLSKQQEISTKINLQVVILARLIKLRFDQSKVLVWMLTIRAKYLADESNCLGSYGMELSIS